MCDGGGRCGDGRIMTISKIQKHVIRRMRDGYSLASSYRSLKTVHKLKALKLIEHSKEDGFYLTDLGKEIQL